MTHAHTLTIEASGVEIRYGFVSEKLCRSLQQNPKRLVTQTLLDEICTRTACKGFFSKHMRIQLDQQHWIKHLEDLREHFAITFYPPTHLIEFHGQHKHALVSIKHFRGHWMQENMTSAQSKGLVFQYHYHDFNTHHHFPVFSLERGRRALHLDVIENQSHQAYLFHDDQSDECLKTWHRAKT